jgi:hypothetical protein
MNPLTMPQYKGRVLETLDQYNQTTIQLEFYAY